MSRAKLLLLLLVWSMATPVWAAPSGAAPSTPSNHTEGEVLVTFKPDFGRPAVEQALGAHGLSIATHFAHLSNQQRRVVVLVRAPQRTTASLVAELAAVPTVETVEPNYLRWLEGMSTPRDPLFTNLWGLQNTGQELQGVSGTTGADIRFVEAWPLRRLSTNPPVVAVIDSGVYYRHPDLAPSMWTNPGEIAANGVDDDRNGYIDDVHGFNFMNGTGDPVDAGEHGTHVAGTIAAAGNNNLGIIGACSEAKIMALRASDDGRLIEVASVLEALEYVLQMRQAGVNIVAINASFGGSDSSSTERAALQSAINAGIVVCAAAGNEGVDSDISPHYPSGYRLPGALAVAASTQMDTLMSFSNYGDTTVDLAAPGFNILSTMPPGLTSSVYTASSSYSATEFEFGPPTTGVTGGVYYCGLGYPADFPSTVRGNIALITRGTLQFSEKTANAKAAGATAAIIYNNTNGPLSKGTLQNPDSWIPVVGLSQADGLDLKARLPCTGTVVSVSSPAPRYAYQDGTSMATPHVAAAVAFSAINFPGESPVQRVARILAAVDRPPGLAGKVITGGRLNLLKTVDSDANTLPDWWEKDFFGVSTGTNPNADPDRDGLSNRQEYLADTSPQDGSSRLRITETRPGGNGTLVKWTGGTNSVIYIQRSFTTSLPRLWIDLSTNTPPVPPGASFLDATGSTNPSAFYRLSAERP